VVDASQSNDPVVLRAEIAQLTARLQELERAAGVEARHRTERRLKASEELNRRILESLPGGLVHVDASGAILRANAEAERILGLEPGTLTTRGVHSPWEAYHEDGRPCPSTEFPVAKALVTGEDQRPTPIGVRRPDGAMSWALYNAIALRDPQTGAVTGAVVTFLDLTERKRADAERDATTALLATVFDAAPNIMMVATPDGVLEYINRTLPPYTCADAVGHPIAEFIPPEFYPSAQAAIRRAVETRGPASYESQGPAKLGRTTWFETRVGPVFKGDVLERLVLISDEITDRKYLEARLLAAERLATLGTLSAGLGHEINNPLTYVLGSLERISLRLRAAGEVDPTELGALVGQALEGAHRIRDILRDLAAFTHEGPGASAPLDVVAVLESALRIAASEVRKKAELVRDYAPIPRVRATASRLGQVLLNLVLNAAQAIPDDERTHSIRVTTRTTPAGEASISITDTGRGIPPENRERIFEPFFTTRPDGSGIGLWLCRTIVRELGGRIELASEIGVGSSFEVVLPPA